jgi:hypothetical protein
MERRPFCEANMRSTGQEIPCFYETQIFYISIFTFLEMRREVRGHKIALSVINSAMVSVVSILSRL